MSRKAANKSISALSGKSWAWIYVKESTGKLYRSRVIWGTCGYGEVEIPERCNTVPRCSNRLSMVGFFWCRKKNGPKAVEAWISGE